MARFLTPLDQRLLGRRRLMTLAPLIYDSDVAQRRIIVPAEFIYDGASVPRVPVAYWFFGGRRGAESALHDYGYQHPDEEDRKLWDLIYYEAMGVHQPELGHEAEPEWVRRAMYSGVRVGGWKAWADHRSRAEVLNPIWTNVEGWPTAPVEAP